MTKNERKILGYSLLIPRLLVMIAASISLYHAFATNSVPGIVAGVFLIITYLADVVYLVAVIVRDFIRKDGSGFEQLNSDLDEMLACEKELFDTHDSKKE